MKRLLSIAAIYIGLLVWASICVMLTLFMVEHLGLLETAVVVFVVSGAYVLLEVANWMYKMDKGSEEDSE